MDLLTQGLLGGVLALSAARDKETRSAAATGFASALVADADVLIGASGDPLLNLEFHRHFSHSLLFIPVGALIAALLLWPILRKRLAFSRIYLYALLGYATSGLLDACTSYGTHLLWPFSDDRIAWSIIAIVDPLFSLILIIAVALGLKHCKPKPARIGLALAGAYLLVGLWQHQNALQSARELAADRGHEVERIIVKPTMANLVLWRSVYQSGEHFYVDAIRVGAGGTRIYQGSSAPLFRLDRDRPQLRQDSALALDIARFSRLSNGYVIADPVRANVLTDIRYSMLPISVTPMWGIDLDRTTESGHAKFEVYRERPENARDLFMAMLLGRDLAE